MDKRIHVKALVLHLLLPLAVGALSGLITRGSMRDYQQLRQPAFAPPGWLFPVVWTVLFLLMGVSAYLVSQSGKPGRSAALKVYGAQLVVNFFWSPIFFNLQAFGAAFFWLLLLIALVIVMIVLFARVSRPAALLQLPYLAWTLFAAVLNFAVWKLNG